MVSLNGRSLFKPLFKSIKLHSPNFENVLVIDSTLLSGCLTSSTLDCLKSMIIRKNGKQEQTLS